MSYVSESAQSWGRAARRGDSLLRQRWRPRPALRQRALGRVVLRDALAARQGDSRHRAVTSHRL
eukprot:4908058-Prymnesium_polylepis.1